MRCERLEVCLVSSQDCAPWFCGRDDERVHRGAMAGEAAKVRCPSSKVRGHGAVDDTCLEEPVDVGITAGVALECLDEDHSENDRWP